MKDMIEDGDDIIDNFIIDTQHIEIEQTKKFSSSVPRRKTLKVNRQSFVNDGLFYK